MFQWFFMYLNQLIILIHNSNQYRVNKCGNPCYTVQANLILVLNPCYKSTGQFKSSIESVLLKAG
jgi:hypothetical protein